MITFEDALRIVLGSARPLGTEHVDIGQAPNRVLAEDVASDIDVPPFDRAVMDGYACRRADLGNPLTVIETVQAGVAPTRAIGANQCAKIMTGAAIPRGADCIIMVEHAEKVGKDTIRFVGGQTADNICRRARDVKKGQVVLHKGTRIGPQHLAVLASVGCSRPAVAKRPKVAILATGDELVAPAVLPGPSEIRNSNSCQVIAQAQSTGAAVRDYGIVKDVAADIDRELKAALAENDVVIVSGGVSVGDFDLVPQVLRENSVELLFEKIAVKPGKPTVFGRAASGWCWGLPGNPVSTFVIFELLVKPFLYKLMGHDYRPTSIPVRLGESLRRDSTDRQGWIPVKVAGDGTARGVEYHGSAHILAVCEADGLVCMERGVSSIDKGAEVAVRLIG